MAMRPPDGEASRFHELLAAVHAAELAADEQALIGALGAVAAGASCAPEAWSSPFIANPFCSDALLAPSPASFWRRLVRRFPGAEEAVGAVTAALADEDLLDRATPDTITIEFGPGPEKTLSLVEGSYANGGVGRHVYAAATALATLLGRGQLIDPRGRRVCELGCGLGLVGLAAARCGALSVLMTDAYESSVGCAWANAAQNGLDEAAGVRAARLDWRDFRTERGAHDACASAGVAAEKGGWWPDMLLAADCCYDEQMGDALIEAIAHLLAGAPCGARAYVLNGWPNRGLARFETLVGARDKLAALEENARAAGEPEAPHRPFVEQKDERGGVNARVADSAPRGIETVRLVAVERLTGFADHAHHLYIFASARDESS